MNEGGNNFGDSLRNIWQKISSPTHTRTISILALLIIIAAVPLTVYIAQKQQEIRQRAAVHPDEPGICLSSAATNKYNCDFGCGSECGDVDVNDPCYRNCITRCTNVYNSEVAICHNAYCDNGHDRGDTWAACNGCDEGTYTCNGGSNYTWAVVRANSPNCGSGCGVVPPVPTTPSCPSGHSCSNWKVKPDDCNWGYCCDPSITSCTGGQGAGVPYNWNGSSWNSTGGAECNFICPVPGVPTVPPTAPPTVPPTTIPGCSGGFASPAFTCGPLAPNNKLNIAAWNLTPPPQGANACNIYIRGGGKDFQISTACSNSNGMTINGVLHDNRGDSPDGVITNDGRYKFFVSNGQSGCLNQQKGEEVVLNCGAPPTATPTPIPGVPTNTPTPTPTIAPNETILNFDLTLVGIGKNIDTGDGGVLPANTSPKTTTKELNVEIYQGANDTTPIKTGKGNVTYDSSSKTFKGRVSLGTDFATGDYVVKVRADKFKKKMIGKGEGREIQHLIRGQDDPNKNLNNLLATLLNGDMNNDGTIDAFDYNIYYSCFGDRTDAACGTNKFNVDLNDDGQTDRKATLAKDYRILIYAFSKVSGD